MLSDKEEEKYQKMIKDGLYENSVFVKSLLPEERDKLTYTVALNFMFSKSASYRGKVIDITIFMEMILAQILTQYFLPKKAPKSNLLNSLVFDRMMITNKLTLLKKIIKLNHQNLWEKYSDDLKNIGKLLEFRNNLAHSMLNSTEERINSLIKKEVDLESIEVVYYQNGELITKSVSKTEVDDFYSEFHRLSKVMLELKNELIES